jgi:hypothetical protein
MGAFQPTNPLGIWDQVKRTGQLERDVPGLAHDDTWRPNRFAIRCAIPDNCSSTGSTNGICLMKFATDRPFSDPEKPPAS